MSYSVRKKCITCDKKDKCIDRYLIDIAVDGLHFIGMERGHYGAGLIEIECINYIEASPTA